MSNLNEDVADVYNALVKRVAALDQKMRNVGITLQIVGMRLREAEDDRKPLHGKRSVLWPSPETMVLRAEVERLYADAELGALVRRMPEGTALKHGGRARTGQVSTCWYAVGGIAPWCGDTPEAALRAALGEEEAT